MKIKWFLLLLIIVILMMHHESLLAQCAMCKANAENSIKEGNDAAKGLNMGIMYLLVIPYLAIGSIGYWWYLKNKKSRVNED